MSYKIKSVGDVLRSDKNFKKFTQKSKEQTVIEKFEDIFPKLAKLAEAKRVEKGTLFIKVENSVLRSELNLNKKRTIEVINKYFDEKIITDIKFVN